ncbi:Thioredoxin reductase [hydrothermal vent metagenome]|uniref:Thioredoxin reductase n=1 Tax=hydrothermal vent metagenome TaxID=652676 RepID=A0A3B0T0N4_9ZZZZ
MDHGHNHTPQDGTANQPDRIRGEAFWDERYRARPAAWRGTPHGHLVAEVTGLAPGTALDVGTGEGADAIWLAEHGWQVTAVDISAVALDRGRTQADSLGSAIANPITWLHADLITWEPPARHFDLVTAQFMHMPSAQRKPLYQRLANSVNTGGHLLIVGHHPTDLDTTALRVPDPDPLFTAQELMEELGDGWTILVQDKRARATVGRFGEDITIHDAVLFARRAG